MGDGKWNWDEHAECPKGPTFTLRGQEPDDCNADRAAMISEGKRLEAGQLNALAPVVAQQTIRIHALEAELAHYRAERDDWRTSCVKALDERDRLTEAADSLSRKVIELVGERDRSQQRLEELWDAIRELKPDLGDANKPLAIAASYALLHAERDRLREALRMQDPRNATECYDKIADDFYRQTRLWPPGRSRPLAMGTDPVDREFVERRWREFVNEWHEKFFDTALAEPKGGEPGSRSMTDKEARVYAAYRRRALKQLPPDGPFIPASLTGLDDEGGE